MYVNATTAIASVRKLEMNRVASAAKLARIHLFG